MHKNARKENCPRRRGMFRRPHFIYLCAGMVFLYIMYKAFRTDSGTSIPSYEKDSQYSQRRIVQGELRTEAPKVEKPPIFDAAAERREQNEERIKSTDHDKEKGDDDDLGDVDEDIDSNQTAKRKEEEDIRRYHLMENLEIENKTDNNNISQPTNTINETLKVVRNETTRLPMLNMTLTNTTGDLKLIDTTAKAQRGDLDMSKAKLVEDISVQTQQLANFVKDVMIKNKMNLTDSYNRTKEGIIGENITKFIDSFTVKAQNTVKLAKDLLGVANASLPNEKQTTAELNKTKLETMYSMEAGDLVKIAKDVLSKSNKTVPDLLFQNKTKMMIEKFAFDAQKLVKFASTMINNTTGNVLDARQKLQNLAAPFQKKSPFINYSIDTPGEVLKVNSTLNNGTLNAV